MKKQLSEILKKSVCSFYKNVKNVDLEYPADESNGDYSSNIALVIFKEVNKEKLKVKSPRELAAFIVKKIEKNKKLLEIIKKIEVAGPGFINFYLNDLYFIKELKKILKEKENFGRSNLGKGKKMIIDYSSPNIAKRFSIGHLRSTIIGQSIYNIYAYLGWRVIGDNHLGDWGTQFGKMIVAIKKWNKKDIKSLNIDELEKLYVKYHQVAENDVSLDDEARKAFKNLEKGEGEERKIFNILIKISIVEYNEIYKILNVSIDKAIGESFYVFKGWVDKVVKDVKNVNLLTKSRGAQIINFDNKTKYPPAIFLKKDGATTYLTRDLAAIKYRKYKWDPNLIVYEVGAEQTLHFKQVFEVAEKLNYIKKENMYHVPHGLIRLKEGKMSTRKGNTIKLKELLLKAIEKVKENYQVSNTLAKKMGIGAIKYNDLKRSPHLGYVFNWDEMLNLKGDSGPYLQYTYARCCSVQKKCSKVVQGCSTLDLTNEDLKTIDINKEEIRILKWLSRFPAVVENAAKEYAPNYICSYLYDLAQRYNSFYNKHSVSNADDKKIKIFRYNLTKITAQVLNNGLNILGIEAPENV